MNIHSPPLLRSFAGDDNVDVDDDHLRRNVAERFFDSFVMHIRPLMESWLAVALPSEPDLRDVVTVVCDTWLAMVDVRIRRGALFVFVNQKKGFPLVDSPLDIHVLRSVLVDDPKMFGTVGHDHTTAAVVTTKMEQFRFNGLAPREKIAKAVIHTLRKMCMEHCPRPNAKAATLAELKKELKRYRDHVNIRTNSFAKRFLIQLLGGDDDEQTTTP